jgi:plastocyanin
MIWRWPIFSKYAAPGHGAILLAVALAAQVCAGTVSGDVRLINDSSAKRPRDFSGVAVWLSASAKGPGHPQKHARMLQEDKRFTPHVLVVETGTTVDFPNLDPIFHNAFSNFNGQIFDIRLYPPGSSRSVQFRRPGIVRIFCNIHPSMSAIIVVVDSSYFTTTEEDGSFSIPDVPAGDYEAHFFHERATPETLERLATPIAVTAGTSKLQAVSISETGYLPVAHKNKYGRDYAPNADGQASYSELVK